MELVEIVWSPEAIEDIELIAEYISRDSPIYAYSVIAKIIDVSRKLTDFPQIGRIVPEIKQDNLRECLVYSYRLVYRLEEKRILIIAVIHGKRLLDNLTDDFNSKQGEGISLDGWTGLLSGSC